MRLWNTLLVCLVLCAAWTAPAFGGPVHVSVSILPERYFVERIGGGHVDVQVMVPPGAQPHSYDPKPGQMARLAKADLYLAIGVPFEAAWLPRFASANPRMRIVDLAAGLERIPISGHHHEGHGHHGHDGEHMDPHVWLSPRNALIMADIIRDELATIDPDHAEYYAAQHRALADDITALDNELTSLFATLPPDCAAPANADGRCAFMVFHPSWGYFARDYGLRQIAVEQDGREPSPSDLAHLVQSARTAGVHVIFVQPQFSRRGVEAIARGIDGQVVPADPLAHDWLSNMRCVARAFHGALRPADALAF
ncbi:zinc transport system substrate-binding protein [Desulfobaculum xiamenense]|uniref:Zinc transport system substrate-binding protein n=1 Tax=Desulfobaculum xiamenense TaxID=995050 RepID=A0A846QRR0_9BACT|nr:zinc ABC transporter substrate-binding protein [Desulfobaculum xiamenense]NJB68085.1 zinc transport system substrate-binding protein [Desulfobaculum xiamenense]